MRLEIFDIMDEACFNLKNNQDLYLESELRIVQCFKSLMTYKEDSIIEFSSRVKTSTSLREKIIRNKLYHHVKSGDEIIDSLHDLIGVTIKCQFIKDEKELFTAIKHQFNTQSYDGYYYNEKFPNILLNLQMMQPQIQKNGFEIYRIDGYCKLGQFKSNFELQIKAMVFTFWSEIEHKVVYKNNNYSLNNAFITSLLDSIRNSLGSIDGQLNIIYNEMRFRNGKKQVLNDQAVKNVIAKSINDLFIGKIQESIGFTINFKKTCDIMSEFFYNREVEDFVIDDKAMIMRMGSRIQILRERKIDFESPIIFDGDIVSDDRFSQIISKAFLFYLNSDFEWYVFFKMLFELLPANNIDDMKLFIKLYRKHFESDEVFDLINVYFNKEEAYEIVDDILAQVAIALIDVNSITILHEDKINIVVNVIEEFTRIFVIDIKNFDNWLILKANILKELNQKIMEIFEHE